MSIATLFKGRAPAFYLPQTRGISNQQLRTDGKGNTFWGDENPSVEPNFTYVKQIKSVNTDNESSQKIDTDTNGDVYVLGNFVGTLNLKDISGNDITLQSATNSLFSLYVIKYNSDGDIIWAKSVLSTVKDLTAREGAIVVDNTNLFICGSFINNVNFDGGLALNNSSQTLNKLFVAKMNKTNGDFVWSRQAGGVNGSVKPYAMTISRNSSNVFICGEISNQVVFGTINQDVPNFSGFVCRINTDGVFNWLRSFEPISVSGVCFPRAIKFNAVGSGDNKLLVCGYFSGTVNFNDDGLILNTVPNAISEGFVACLNPSAQSNPSHVSYAKQTSTQIQDEVPDVLCLDLCTDGQNRMFITGKFIGNDIKFFDGVGTLNSNGTDCFICALRIDDGVLEWVENYGARSEECIGLGIDYDTSSGLFLSGAFTGNVQFNQITLRADNKDIFIAKVNDNNGLILIASQIRSLDNSRESQTSNSTLKFGENGNLYLSGYLTGVGPYVFGELGEIQKINPIPDSYVNFLTKIVPQTSVTNLVSRGFTQMNNHEARIAILEDKIETLLSST